MTDEQRALPARGPGISLWWRVLITTLLAFSMGIMVMVLTANPIL